MEAATASSVYPARPRRVRLGNLEVRGPGEVWVDASRLTLTRTEFAVLMAMLERRTEVVERAALFAAVWGGAPAPRDRRVDVYVKKLRQKLTEAAPDWTYIHTHFGWGYRFEPIHGSHEEVTS